MKIYKFRIVEHWIGGTKPPRYIEIKGHTQKAAYNKLLELKGNRNWDIEVVP